MWNRKRDIDWWWTTVPKQVLIIGWFSDKNLLTRYRCKRKMHFFCIFLKVKGQFQPTYTRSFYVYMSMAISETSGITGNFKFPILPSTYTYFNRFTRGITSSGIDADRALLFSTRKAIFNFFVFKFPTFSIFLLIHLCRWPKTFVFLSCFYWVWIKWKLKRALSINFFL